jgi:chemotaxis protein CheC
MVMLEPLELDALTELVNIGVSRAAASLRKMVGQQIVLSVPAIEMMPASQAAKLIWEREARPIVAVSQEFAGPFSGRALLIFPEDSGTSLVAIVAGGAMPEDQLKGFEDEALSETGNIVLNACLGSIANMLQRSLHLSPPQVVRGDGRDLFHSDDPTDAGVVLFLYINFAVEDRAITGYIAMVMDLPSLETLKLVIRDFIGRVMGSDPPLG